MGESIQIWHDGTGFPSWSLGKDGDYYLQVDNGNVYKKDGQWLRIGNMKGKTGDKGIDGIPGAIGPEGIPGDDGRNGNGWHDGVGTPIAKVGVIGDYFLDVANGDIYKKINYQNWDRIGNLKGEKGDTPSIEHLEQTIEELKGIAIEESAALSLQEQINQTNTQLNTKAREVDVFDYSYNPQDTLPPKQGFKSCSPKIVKKLDSRTLMIIQKTNKGWIKSIYNDKYIAPTDDSNYGGVGGPLRLIDARHIIQAYVYKDISTPSVGELAISVPPGLAANVVEGMIMDMTGKNDSRSISSKSNTEGFGIYQMTYGQSVSYSIQYTLNNKGNILFRASSGSVECVNIYINNVLVKTFNPRMYVKPGDSVGVGLVDFDLPTLSQTTSYTLRIDAVGNVGVFYPCCINYYPLDKYDGQAIDQWKAYGSEQGVSFITTAENTKAFADSANRWFGGYHGGETLDECLITWIDLFNFEKRESDIKLKNFFEVSSETWRVFKKDFEIKQRTTLIGKAKMNSVHNFSEDGTINMNEAFDNTSENPILLNAFYPSLTCTSPSFDKIIFPIYKELSSTATGNSIQVPINEGFVSQYDSVNRLQLDTRFTKFNYKHNAKKCYVLDSSYYKKLYCGVVSNNQNVLIQSLQFKKALDFIIR